MGNATKRGLTALSLLVLFALTACGNTGESRGGDSNAAGLSGNVTGDGSSTVFLISEAIAEEFQKENPEVQVSVGVSGTGSGFKRFCAGETDFQDASRPIKDSEIEACRAAGVEYVELTVALDGLAVVANPGNTWADCLTVEELKKIWAPGSAVGNWRDVRSGFPDRALKLYGPGTESGTFDYFTEAITGEVGSSRTDYTASEEDFTLVSGVEGDVGALGYFGFAYYSQSKGNLKLLEIDGGEGCVKPADETVRDGTYKPLSRPLFIYVKKASLAQPEVKAFIDFYLETLEKVLPDVGYTALNDAELEREIAELNAFVS